MVNEKEAYAIQDNKPHKLCHIRELKIEADDTYFTADNKLNLKAPAEGTVTRLKVTVTLKKKWKNLDVILVEILQRGKKEYSIVTDKMERGTIDIKKEKTIEEDKLRFDLLINTQMIKNKFSGQIRIELKLLPEKTHKEEKEKLLAEKTYKEENEEKKGLTSSIFIVGDIVGDEDNTKKEYTLGLTKDEKYDMEHFDRTKNIHFDISRNNNIEKKFDREELLQEFENVTGISRKDMEEEIKKHRIKEVKKDVILYIISEGFEHNMFKLVDPISVIRMEPGEEARPVLEDIAEENEYILKLLGLNQIYRMLSHVFYIDMNHFTHIDRAAKMEEALKLVLTIHQKVTERAQASHNKSGINSLLFIKPFSNLRVNQMDMEHKKLKAMRDLKCLTYYDGTRLYPHGVEEFTTLVNRENTGIPKEIFRKLQKGTEMSIPYVFQHVLLLYATYWRLHPEAGINEIDKEILDEGKHLRTLNEILHENARWERITTEEEEEEKEERFEMELVQIDDPILKSIHKKLKSLKTHATKVNQLNPQKYARFIKLFENEREQLLKSYKEQVDVHLIIDGSACTGKTEFALRYCMELEGNENALPLYTSFAGFNNEKSKPLQYILTQLEKDKKIWDGFDQRVLVIDDCDHVYHHSDAVFQLLKYFHGKSVKLIFLTRRRIQTSQIPQEFLKNIQFHTFSSMRKAFQSDKLHKIAQEKIFNDIGRLLLDEVVTFLPVREALENIHQLKSDSQYINYIVSCYFDKQKSHYSLKENSTLSQKVKKFIKKKTNLISNESIEMRALAYLAFMSLYGTPKFSMTSEEIFELLFGKVKLPESLLKIKLTLEKDLEETYLHKDSNEDVVKKQFLSMILDSYFIKEVGVYQSDQQRYQISHPIFQKVFAAKFLLNNRSDQICNDIIDQPQLLDVLEIVNDQTLSNFSLSYIFEEPVEETTVEESVTNLRVEGIKNIVSAAEKSYLVLLDEILKSNDDELKIENSYDNLDGITLFKAMATSKANISMAIHCLKHFVTYHAYISDPKMIAIKSFNILEKCHKSKFHIHWLNYIKVSCINNSETVAEIKSTLSNLIRDLGASPFLKECDQDLWIPKDWDLPNNPYLMAIRILFEIEGLIPFLELMRSYFLSPRNMNVVHFAIILNNLFLSYEYDNKLSMILNDEVYERTSTFEDLYNILKNESSKMIEQHDNSFIVDVLTIQLFLGLISGHKKEVLESFKDSVRISQKPELFIDKKLLLRQLIYLTSCSPTSEVREECVSAMEIYEKDMTKEDVNFMIQYRINLALNSPKLEEKELESLFHVMSRHIKWDTYLFDLISDACGSKISIMDAFLTRFQKEFKQQLNPSTVFKFYEDISPTLLLFPFKRFFPIFKKFYLGKLMGVLNADLLPLISEQIHQFMEHFSSQNERIQIYRSVVTSYKMSNNYHDMTYKLLMRNLRDVYSKTNNLNRY